MKVVNRGEMFDDCGFANKWEWVSVNGSRIGLVGRREQPVGLFFCFFAPTAAILNSDLLLSMMKETTLRRKNTS